MQMNITTNCINCGACAYVCPAKAIFQPKKTWRIKNESFKPLSSTHFFIVPQICNQCEGFNTIQCIEICPMNAIKIETSQIDLIN
jgi:ferredoxin